MNEITVLENMVAERDRRIDDLEVALVADQEEYKSKLDILQQQLEMAIEVFSEICARDADGLGYDAPEMAQDALKNIEWIGKESKNG